MPSSASASSTTGCTDAPGSLPAERATSSPARARKIRSAMSERPEFATHTKSTFISAAPCARSLPDDGQPALLGLARPHRLDDCAVHAVGDAVGEGDLDLVETRDRQAGFVFGTRQRARDAAG